MTIIDLRVTDECAPSDTYPTNTGYSVVFKADNGDEYFVEYPRVRNEFLFTSGVKYKITFRGVAKHLPSFIEGMPGNYRISGIIKVVKL